MAEERRQIHAEQAVEAAREIEKTKVSAFTLLDGHCFIGYRGLHFTLHDEILHVIELMRERERSKKEEDEEISTQHNGELWSWRWFWEASF